MKRQIIKIKYQILAIAIAIFLIFSFGVGAGTARADTEESAAAKYERQNVWDDLQGAKIDGEGLDLSVYNFDSKKEVQIISFIEFCYSPFADKQNDFGLYIYVYNPRGLDFKQNPEENKIQFRYTGKSASEFDKYELKYVNESNKPGYEGLFYKFKVNLTDGQRTAILNTLNSTERVYEVSGIELYSSGTNAHEYKISNKYTYTGFAKGYGSSSASEDSLKCVSDGIDVTLSLQPKATFYMPEGTNGKKYTHDALYSVYFSIPNEILDIFGGLSAVHATWLNATLAPMLVTGNDTYYDEFFKQVGKNIGEPESYADLKFYQSFRSEATESSFIIGGQKFSGYLHGYNYPSKLGNTDIAKIITTLTGVFKALNGNADTWTVPSEEILKHLETYSQKKLSELITGSDTPLDKYVLGKYSTELFENVDEEFTDKVIFADDKYDLQNEKLTQSFWDKLFGVSGNKVESSIPLENIKALEIVPKDIFDNNDKTAICEKLYIDLNDYDDFSNFCIEEQSNDNSVFLFRYKQAEYFSAEVREGTWHRTWSLTGGVGGYRYSFKDDDTNAYIMQQNVSLDFDIIDVTCRKGNVDTVIACIMSPLDVAIDGRHPLVTTEDPSNWWIYALILIAGLIGIAVVTGLLSKKIGVRAMTIIGSFVAFSITLILRITAQIYMTRFTWLTSLVLPLEIACYILLALFILFIVIEIIGAIRAAVAKRNAQPVQIGYVVTEPKPTPANKLDRSGGKKLKKDKKEEK